MSGERFAARRYSTTPPAVRDTAQTDGRTDGDGAESRQFERVTKLTLLLTPSQHPELELLARHSSGPRRLTIDGVRDGDEERGVVRAERDSGHLAEEVDGLNTDGVARRRAHVHHVHEVRA